MKTNRLPALQYSVGHWPRANRLLGSFDPIIGSDLPYERCQPEQLSKFLQIRALSRAEVLIVDPNRGNRAAFHRRMATAGFVLTESLLGAGPSRARLLSYRR